MLLDGSRGRRCWRWQLALGAGAADAIASVRPRNVGSWPGGATAGAGAGQREERGKGLKELPSRGAGEAAPPLAHAPRTPCFWSTLFHPGIYRTGGSAHTASCLLQPTTRKLAMQPGPEHGCSSRAEAADTRVQAVGCEAGGHTRAGSRVWGGRTHARRRSGAAGKHACMQQSQAGPQLRRLRQRWRRTSARSASCIACSSTLREWVPG